MSAASRGELFPMDSRSRCALGNVLFREIIRIESVTMMKKSYSHGSQVEALDSLQVTLVIPSMLADSGRRTVEGPKGTETWPRNITEHLMTFLVL
jgi:hypothetical protein